MKGNIQNLEDTITDKAISEILLDIRHEPPHDMMPFLSSRHLLDFRDFSGYHFRLIDIIHPKFRKRERTQAIS